MKKLYKKMEILLKVQIVIPDKYKMVTKGRNAQ